MEVRGEIPRKIRSKMLYFLTYRSICASKKFKKQRKSAFRRTTRRKVIQATPGIFVTSKSKYGGKGQNHRKIRAEVLLTLRAGGQKAFFPFPEKSTATKVSIAFFAMPGGEKRYLLFLVASTLVFVFRKSRFSVSK